MNVKGAGVDMERNEGGMKARDRRQIDGQIRSEVGAGSLIPADTPDTTTDGGVIASSEKAFPALQAESNKAIHVVLEQHVDRGLKCVSDREREALPVLIGDTFQRS